MIKFIRDLKFWQKLLLLIAMQTIPLVIAVASYDEQARRTIATTELAIVGLDYAEPLADLASAISEHKIVVGARAVGSARLDEHGKAVIEEGQALMAALAQQQETNGERLGVGPEYDELVQAWGRVVASDSRSDVAQVGEVHRQAIAAAARLRHVVESNSGLAFDPVPKTTHLIAIATDGVSDLFAAGGSIATAVERLRAEGTSSYAARRAMSIEEGQAIEVLATISDELKAAVAAYPGLGGKFDAGFAKIQTEWGKTLAAVRPLLEAPVVSSAAVEAFSIQLVAAFGSVHEVHDPVSKELHAALDQRLADERQGRWLLLGVMLVGFLAVTAFSTWLARELGRRLDAADAAMRAIAAGQLDVEIKADGRDEIGMIVASVASMRDKLRAQLSTEREVAAENLRVRLALDSSSSAVMLADQSGSIVFMNRTAGGLFKDMESEIQRAIPKFRADKIVGSSFDIFHANPGKQRGMLQALQGGHVARIPLGGRQMQISAYPVKDTAGGLLGYAVEWLDRTAEDQAEQEIAKVVGAAVDGDLTQRLSLVGKSGFFAALSKQVNVLLETNQSIFGDLGRVFAALSKGRLSETITNDYRGAYASVRDDVNETIRKLISVVEQIQMACDVVNSSATQLSSGNENLSQRTTQQAASLEETAASIEELTSTVRHNADNASQANQLATATRSLAEKGGDVVTRAVTAMRAINESSRQIADIISVIDEIAFQTNLLALNAAVEAARAGEQGRGFAVVAAEVRALAQRSAESAKEIKQLIQDSVSKVDNGSQLVDESGRTLEEIVGSVKRVTDLIAEITAASREQATGVEEINKAVTQMDQVTTQNASLVDEASAGTHALAEQAKSLSQVVAFFDVGAPRRAAAPAPAARPAAAPVSAPVAAVAKASAPAARASAPAARASAPAARASAPAARPPQGSAPPQKPAPRKAEPAAPKPAVAVAASGAGDDWDTF